MIISLHCIHYASCCNIHNIKPERDCKTRCQQDHCLTECEGDISGYTSIHHIIPVSYTHLDVYKRQSLSLPFITFETVDAETPASFAISRIFIYPPLFHSLKPFPKLFFQMNLSILLILVQYSRTTKLFSDTIHNIYCLRNII